LAAAGTAGRPGIANLRSLIRYDSDALDDMLNEEGGYEEGTKDNGQALEFDIPIRARHHHVYQDGAAFAHEKVGRMHVDENDVLRTGRVMKMPFLLKPTGP
jgi:hypothetical protein